MAEIFEKVLVLIKSKRNKTIKNFGGKDYVRKY